MGQAIKDSVHPLMWQRPSNDDHPVPVDITELSIENHRRWVIANYHLGVALEMFDQIGNGAYVTAGDTQSALDMSKRHLRKILREGIEIPVISDTDLTPYWQQMLSAELAATKM